MEKPRIICLMGPTASGKTPLAVELVQRFPLEIISVDSAMVYRGMDIGTAKPDADTLKKAPHRLIDIVDPSKPYSAGNFCRDALQAINEIHLKGKTPLLVGGTMMYFRALQQGMAVLPTRDDTLRKALSVRAEQEGWGALHQSLAAVDPESAARINPADGQRIQRALEVFMLTGKTMTAIQHETKSALADFKVINIGLTLAPRAWLHERIALRFEQMLEQGFIHEVNRLYQRGDLNADMPSMRSVGYREVWQYFNGEIDYDHMKANAIAATRQLAKRQLTWLRSWPGLIEFDSSDAKYYEEVAALI